MARINVDGNTPRQGVFRTRLGQARAASDARPKQAVAGKSAPADHERSSSMATRTNTGTAAAVAPHGLGVLPGQQRRGHHAATAAAAAASQNRKPLKAKGAAGNRPRHYCRSPPASLAALRACCAGSS